MAFLFILFCFVLFVHFLSLIQTPYAKKENEPKERNAAFLFTFFNLLKIVCPLGCSKSGLLLKLILNYCFIFNFLLIKKRSRPSVSPFGKDKQFLKVRLGDLKSSKINF